MTPLTKIIVVHELIHALADQHFDLSTLTDLVDAGALPRGGRLPGARRGRGHLLPGGLHAVAPDRRAGGGGDRVAGLRLHRCSMRCPTGSGRTSPSPTTRASCSSRPWSTGTASPPSIRPTTGCRPRWSRSSTPRCTGPSSRSREVELPGNADPPRLRDLRGRRARRVEPAPLPARRGERQRLHHRRRPGGAATTTASSGTGPRWRSPTSTRATRHRDAEELAGLLAESVRARMAVGSPADRATTPW